MTKREKHIVLLVGIVIAGWFIFRFWPQQSGPSENSDNHQFSLTDADRLLRSRQNIIARNKAINGELKTLQQRFYNAAQADNAKIALLKTVEGIAAQTSLAVEQKNMVSIHDDTIGVALEGKTSPESLIRFLQQITQSPIGLRIQRLQIHSLPETKQLNYQVAVITLVVKK
ncbi:MAG TPA: hypothetical protein DDW50_12675 [Firmicutes bacterium]|jgi:hypothetical protein|nr:hypothetical protein [Bacillota bacterium]